MRTKVLDGVTGNGDLGSVFFDAETQMAFGPVFTNGRDARRFLSYLADLDLDPVNLDWVAYGRHLYACWISEGKPAKAKRQQQHYPERFIPTLPLGIT